VTLLCSQFDPVRAIYTAAVTRVLQATCGVTVLSLGGTLFWPPQATFVGGMILVYTDIACWRPMPHGRRFASGGA
jgi:hypothetical protein